MKATTLQARIEKNFTNPRFTLIDKLVRGIPIYKQWSRKNRRYYLITDDYDDAVSICRILKLDYEEGNNAPRGGKDGDFVRLTDKGIKQVADYAKMRIEREKQIEIEREKQAEIARQETEKTKKIYELECVSTYALLAGKNIDLTKTKAYSDLQKFTPNYRHRKAFYHYLAAELHVKNNEGLRRYVNEKVKL